MKNAEIVENETLAGMGSLIMGIIFAISLILKFTGVYENLGLQGLLILPAGMFIIFGSTYLYYVIKNRR
ncbi:MAG: hypothetical protein LLF83_10775 [Methanobacterium sp.]|nr:hypothetical protein [Methanobacterium sp.]